jgi:hypothetical protein
MCEEDTSDMSDGEYAASCVLLTPRLAAATDRHTIWTVQTS